MTVGVGPLARESSGCDYEQQARRPLGEPAGANLWNLEAVVRQFTKETSDKQQELFSIAMKQWQTQGHSEVRSTGARNTQVIRAQLHRNGQACEAVRRRMHCVCSQVQYCHVS